MKSNKKNLFLIRDELHNEIMQEEKNIFFVLFHWGNPPSK
jgi:hypothetical protein